MTSTIQWWGRPIRFAQNSSDNEVHSLSTHRSLFLLSRCPVPGSWNPDLMGIGTLTRLCFVSHGVCHLVSPPALWEWSGIKKG